jgi:hypothetical protein
VALLKTLRHFFPQFNQWLDQLPDTRYQPMVVYDQKFLLWWGLLLFCCKLGSRRQLDYALRDTETAVLDNVNQLAATTQETLPVHKTLDHFLGHVGPVPLAQLRSRCLRRLIRLRVLDAGRLLGRLVVAVDGSGFVVFHQPHCAHCLTMQATAATVYLHPVLEAKLVDPRGLALSMGTEFIENPGVDAGGRSAALTWTDYEQIKQDCELTAWARLASQLKEQFPQTALCISGDSLYGCGPAIRLCQQNGWSFVFTFKAGRTPALWQDFQGLLQLCPQNALRVRQPDGLQQLYRWVEALDYSDDQGRTYRLNGLLCEETTDNQTRTFAWLTDLPLKEHTVIGIAEKGGRNRWKIENEGFNIQKNSGLNLEHAYSWDPQNLKSFYYLLQVAHLLLQLWEKGSPLRQLARQRGGNVVTVFGSLLNLSRRLLDWLRYFVIPPELFEPHWAVHCQVRLDGS